jgi:predicted metalloprotease with PDZ domain
MRKFLFLLVAATPAFAQPQPAKLPPPIMAPQDKPLPGQIVLTVDATDLDRHVIHTTETVPVPPDGKLTLMPPKWLPGNHGPTGPIAALAGLVVTANGQTLDWQRDTVDIGAFHVAVPGGTQSVDVAFDYLSPLDAKDGRVVITPNMLDVSWRPEMLFPAGYFQRDIMVKPAVKLPAGWQYATALDTVNEAAGRVEFKPLPLETLLDSPLYAGRYSKKIDLDPGGPAPVHLDVFADSPDDLKISPADLAAHKNLVQQAYRNFGSHHYDHYDFLFSLSDEMGSIGLEHQRSSEDGTGPAYFTDPAKSAIDRELLPHEYTHSWNGKFRRPADLWSPDEHTVPEQDTLLWVYEGQTDYWGWVLAARAGIITPAQARDGIALYAAQLNDATPGRIWRNLQDTTNDPVIAWGRPPAWRSWSRFYDYYPEGLLIWLDADTLIREKTNGARSLTDFTRAFYGVDDGKWQTETYTFDDVVHALNQVVPYDWAGFLRERLDSKKPTAPLNGLTQGGWKLVYTSEASAMEKSADARRKSSDYSYSLGFSIAKDGTIESVLWGSPAFKAGIARGAKLLAVDNIAAEDSGVLDDAIIAAASGGKPPITLLLRNGRYYRTVQIDYHGGLRYPHLQRIAGTPDRLDDILAPLK